MNLGPGNLSLQILCQEILKFGSHGNLNNLAKVHSALRKTTVGLSQEDRTPEKDFLDLRFETIPNGMFVSEEGFVGGPNEKSYSCYR